MKHYPSKLVAQFLVLIASVTWGYQAFSDVGQDLRTTLETQLVLSEEEDLAGVMALMHSESPVYQTQQKVVNQISAVYDLKYELLDFTYIGRDDEFAYARSRLLTTRVDGPRFRDNILEALAVFKQENGQWRFWNQANLRVTFQ